MIAKRPKVTPITDSASGRMDKSMPSEIRVLRIVAMPVTLLVNTIKGLWFLLCALADALWDDAFGESERTK